MKENYFELLCDILCINTNEFFVVGRKIYNPKHIRLNEPIPISIKGEYYPNLDMVYVNFDNHKNEIDILFTMAYELRRAYQWKQVKIYEGYVNDDELLDMNICERDDVIQNWRKDFINAKKSGDENFHNQSIELDAIAFALYINEKVLNVSVQLGDEIDKEMLQKSLDYIELSYDDDLIQDCIKECLSKA